MEKNNYIAELENIPETYYGFIFHYYRAEVYRETNWRNRLDTTTNWSIVVTGAILTFAFTNEITPPSIILVNYFIVWFFLYIESRRFRYYWLLRERTRAIEKQLLTNIFLGKSKKINKRTWKQIIADSFRSQKVSMSKLESIAWRFRRNYFFLLPLIFISWIARVSSFPYPVHTAWEFFENAGIWFFPGLFVFIILIMSIFIIGFISFYIPGKRIHADTP